MDAVLLQSRTLTGGVEDARINTQQRHEHRFSSSDSVMRSRRRQQNETSSRSSASPVPRWTAPEEGSQQVEFAGPKLPQRVADDSLCVLASPNVIPGAHLPSLFLGTTYDNHRRLGELQDATCLRLDEALASWPLSYRLPRPRQPRLASARPAAPREEPCPTVRL